MSEGKGRPDLGIGRSVLIVDDDRCFAESLEDILVAKGYQISVVGDADAAVQVLRARSRGDDAIAVALVDVRLGVASSGVDLLSRLGDEWPDLVCVMMTADVDTQTAIEALRRGPTIISTNLAGRAHCWQYWSAASKKYTCSETAGQRLRPCAQPKRKQRRRTRPSPDFSRR